MAIISLPDGRRTWRRFTPSQQVIRWFAYLIGIAAFVWCWNRISEATTWFFVWDAPRIAGDILTRAMPPRWSYMENLWVPIWDTINIATLGTIAALMMAVPVAFMAARNTTPQMNVSQKVFRLIPPFMRPWLLTSTGEDSYSIGLIRPLALLVIVSTRSINSLIWALLLIAIIGPGVFAGIIAIAIRSIGFCAKLLYEAIEEIDHGQVEAITATGASRWQVMAYGIVPQIMPAFAGISVFRWDINIRESTVLGLVGAGGIGLQLSSSLNVLAWPQVALILLVILAAVVISEWVSAKVRGAII